MLLALRHALRMSEVVDLGLADIDLTSGRIFCRRLKGSVSDAHPMEGDEIRAARKWLRDRPDAAQDFVFLSERGSPLTRQAAWRIVKEAGERAGLEVEVHAHMLKHSCGFFLETGAMTPGSFRTTWAIGRFRTPSVIRPRTRSVRGYLEAVRTVTHSPMLPWPAPDDLR